MKRPAMIAAACLVAIYALNVAINAVYKSATQDRVDLLNERSEDLARINPRDARIKNIRDLIEAADYNSFTAFAPFALAQAASLGTYLSNHPHLSLGIAVDGTGLSEPRIAAVLTDINRHLAPHKISVGLSEPVRRIRLPPHPTRDDVVNGVTTAFAGQPDFHIALTAKTCSYEPDQPRAKQPASNRMFTFGLRRLAIVDTTALDAELTDRLRIALASHLIGNRREHRWTAKAYNRRFKDMLAQRQVFGRAVRDVRRRGLPKRDWRTVRITVGLDNVSVAEARNVIDEDNELYARYGIRFNVQHHYRHTLGERWKWPLEIKRMQDETESEINVLMTSAEWTSHVSGHLRGLGSAFFGAVMVQAGTRPETTKRLAHELGHLFGLPHTFLRGTVMYPSEDGIGLNWSPGSDRRLKENRLTATWKAVKTYQQRFEIATQLAPILRRKAAVDDKTNASGAASKPRPWMACKETASD